MFGPHDFLLLAQHFGAGIIIPVLIDEETETQRGEMFWLSSQN